MRSLIIFPGYYIPHIGGLETHVDEFVKHLSQEKDYKITIFAPRIPEDAKKYELRWNNVRVIRYPAFEIISNYPLPKFWNFEFWSMFFKLREDNFNLVMTRTRFFFNSFLGYIFAKWRWKALKLMHVEHGSSFVILSSKWKTKLAKMYDLTVGKMIVKNSDKVVAISKAVKDFLVKEFKLNAEDVPVIYRGIETEAIDKIKQDALISKKFEGRRKFLYVGRLYKWKGVENSIKAVQALPEEIKKKIVFLIVGYGEDEERLKQLAGVELGKSIFFLGKKSFEQSVAVMKSGDYYLHSSYPGGGLSSSLLQAMYCGCVPIASPHEGAEEVVNEDNGYLLQDNHSLSFKKKLIQLINNIEKVETRKMHLREDIFRMFNWNENVSDYNLLLNSILG